MLRILLLTTCLCLVWALVSAETTAAKLGPRGYLPNDVFEFEAVVEGTRVNHDFTIYNKGDEPLKILKVKSG